MGEDLLKKTGAGNLFMVFGEPDIDLLPQPDGQLVAEVHGLDVYDPTTGQIRSSSTDDVACWFLDTNYNGESFFVRHAYFTGGDDPTSGCSAPSAPKSTKPRGRASTPLGAVRSRARTPARSR